MLGYIKYSLFTTIRFDTFKHSFIGTHEKVKSMGNNSEHGINIENMKNDERVRNLNMTEFYIETLPDVFIVYCEYHRNVSKSAECMRSILGHFRVN